MELPAEVFPVAEKPRLEPRGGRHVVTYGIPIPYFGFLWSPLLAGRARRIEEAADAGRPLPTTTPWWAPPVSFDARTSQALAALCLLSLVWSYGGGTLGLLTQTLPYAADAYAVDDRTLAIGLAVVRAGVILALLLGPLADRLGRRRLVIYLAVAHCLLVAVAGLAPDFEAYIGVHVILRCLDTALSIAIAVLVAELVPAGSRAISLSLVALSAGGGIVLAVAVLPLAAAGRGGFTAVYLLQLLAIPLVLHSARWISESARFARHEGERHGYLEVLRPPYRRRAILLAATIFLAAAFTAPTLEFTTRYLDEEHSFSAAKVVLFLAVTGLPSFPMLIVGGRLADLRSRKSVGIPLVIASALCYAGFYLASGPLLWILACGGAMLGSAGGAALSPYPSELFPTRIRSAAQTLTIAIGVLGSAFGLGVVAVLSGSLELGPSIACLAILPVISAFIFAFAFAETARRELEDTSLEGGRPPV
ncbi:MAG: hypothetical protein QOI31_2710 [Solirubrobacterales bacterium]|jgi:predicted MFS family arabinose efflux permease|nr:hypothetical protein [Solirubrobacterales bacterium]